MGSDATKGIVGLMRHLRVVALAWLVGMQAAMAPLQVLRAAQGPGAGTGVICGAEGTDEAPGERRQHGHLPCCLPGCLGWPDLAGLAPEAGPTDGRREAVAAVAPGAGVADGAERRLPGRKQQPRAPPGMTA